MAAALICMLVLSDAAAAQAPILSASEIDYPPFCFVDADGNANGFSIELMRAALATMNREVTFRSGPWSEVRSWLERGEIQALPLVGRTPEREPLFDFTFPYMSLHGAIVVRKDNTDIKDIEDLRGRRVVVMKSDSAEEFLRREERGIEIHTTATFDDALRELSKGRYDAVVIQRIVGLRLIQEIGFINLKVIEKPVEGFRQDFCFAVDEGDRKTLELLNEGLAVVMADGTYSYLHSKWFAALQLPSSRHIVVGGDYKNPPYEYLDENGRPAGYSVDLTRAIAREMGMDIEIRLGPWVEIIQALEEGKIDVIEGMSYSVKRDLKFDFTQPHSVKNYISVVRKGEGDPPATVNDLAGKSIVVRRGDVIYDFLVENGLEKQVSFADSLEDVLRELARGKYDCALAVRINSMYLIERLGLKNLNLGRHSFASREYCYAVANNRKALLAQFSEGLKVLEKNGEYRRIHEKWLGGYREGPLSIISALRYSAIILVPLFLLLLAVFLWSWSLRRRVSLRTQELRESVDKFQYIFEAANVGKTIVMSTNERYVNKAYEDFLGYTKDELRKKTWQELTPSEDIETVQKEVDPLIRGEKDSTRFEKRYIHKNGYYVWADISLKARRDEEGNIIYYFTTIVDITERKWAEEALRESEEFQSVMITCSPVALFSINLDGKVLSWNSSAERIFGWRADEVLGNTIPIVPDGKNEEFEELRRQAVSGEGFIGRELMRKRKDGTLFPISLSVAPVRNEKGKAVGIMAAAEDITIRKQAEEALREERQRLASIIAGTRVGTWEWNVQTGETIFNDRWAEIIGYTLEEISPVSIEIWTKFAHPDDLEVSNNLLEKHFSGELDYYECESRMKHKDGSWIWVLDRGKVSSWTGDGKPLWMYGTHQDITERKQAEEALRESEARYRNTIDSMLEGCTIIGPDWKYLYVNETAAEQGRKTREELIGRSMKEVYEGLDTTKMFHVLQHCMRERVSERMEFKIIHRDGTREYFDLGIQPIPEGLFVISMDITDRKKAEEEREKLQAQLLQAQKMESIGRLAGGVAHDYNNTLSIIIGYADLAMRKVKPDDPLYTDLMQIRNAGERSRDITRQLLAFARKETIAPVVLDLNATVENMLKILRRLIGEYIDLAWLPGSGLWPVMMDPSQVDQIIANLCVNARDAISDIGKITIETNNISFDSDYCADHADCLPGDYVLLAVSDDGCGMDKEMLENIFEPFFTTKDVGKGTGLGLAMVYGIIKQNNGFTNVYSEPDNGTTFKIYLPRYGGEIIKDREQEKVEAPGGSGETLLVVEDEIQILKLTETILSGLNYRVLTASTPGEALKLAKEHADEISLLITDVVMPEMSGRELAEQIKAFCPNIKYLYMSGYTADVIAHRGVLDKGLRFIQKPFLSKDLANKVRAAIDE